MAYDPNRSVTVSNCPTRAALERDVTPQRSEGFGIGGKRKKENAAKKRAAHAANHQERAARNQGKAPKKVKVEK